MKGMIAVCAALLVAGGLANGASAATEQLRVEASAPVDCQATTATADGARLRLADGGFISGLAVGVIGSLIVQGIEDDRGRYYRRRHHRSCRYWHYRCRDDWGYRSRDYFGCMRYHGC